MFNSLRHWFCLADLYVKDDTFIAIFIVKSLSHAA